MTIDTGKYIKKIRSEKGISQAEFGKLINKPNSRISEWETGKHTINLEDFLIICKKSNYKDFNKLFSDIFS